MEGVGFATPLFFAPTFCIYKQKRNENDRINYH